MEQIRIYVITNGVIPKMLSNFHFVLQTGSRGKKSIVEGCARDDSGNNISERNSKYAELTGLYWIWKNQNAEYVGMLQYKRRFAIEYGCTLFGRRLIFGYHILSSKDMMHCLRKYDAIVAEEDLGSQTVDLQFRTGGNRGLYPGIILDATEEIIKKEFPEYYDELRKVMNGTVINPHNMIVARKDILDKYCEFLFPILERLDEYVPVGFDNANYNRMYGWLAERLLGVYLKHYSISYKKFPVVDIEHTKLTANRRLGDFLQRCWRRLERK